MSLSRQALGRWGENLAADYLIKKGYRIIEQNVRTSYGEIDLIVQKGDFLVFVEVKTRSTNTFGAPETSVTHQKQEHLIAAAQSYIQTSTKTDIKWRIDVIAIRKLKPEISPEIIHFENAIT